MNQRLLLLCALSASLSAPEVRSASSSVEGVRGVRQEGSGKVKEVEPSTKNVAPGTAQGVDQVDGVKVPGGAQVVKQTPPPASVTEGAKPVEGAGTKATPLPPSSKGVEGAGTKAAPSQPSPQGVEGVKGVKPPEAVKGAGAKGTLPPPAKGFEGVKPPQGVKPTAGGIKPVEGLTGIGAGKQQNLEAALQIKPAEKPEPKRAKAAAALLGGPEPKPKPEKQDDRKLFEEVKKITDNGS